MSSVVNFSTDSAESKNAARLLRRGKLRPDWTRAEPWDGGEFLLPFAGPSGKFTITRLSATEMIVEAGKEFCECGDLLSGTASFRLFIRRFA